MSNFAESIIKRFNSLKNEQSKWIGVWKDCARYCAPTSSPLAPVKARGAKKRQPIDPVGIECLNKLVAWLYSSTVYQGEQWFDFKEQTNKNSKSDTSDSNKERFLQDLARRTLEIITSSNFSTTYQKMLRPYVAFGTGAFYSEFNEDNELICKEFEVPNCIYIAEDSKGSVDTVFRRFEFTARQAVQEFGEENVSDDIKKAYRDINTQDTRFAFIHAVYPRKESEIEKGKRTPENKPIASVYVEEGQKKLVLEGGYNTMPYCIPRFYNTGELYGRAPTMDAIESIKAVNIAVWSYLKNVEGQTKPIIFAPSSIYDKMSIELGSINPWDSSLGDIKIWSPSGDTNSALEFAQMKRQEVGAMFYNDVFQYLEDRKNMTATEAQLRYDEMIQAVSPVLANLHTEFFSPLLTRIAYEICDRGLIDIPEQYRAENNGVLEFEVVYNTRLDTKLKGVLNANIINFVRIVGELGVALGMPALPSAYIDVDKVMKKYATNSNVINDALKSDEEIEESLKAISEQAQQKMLLDMINKINLQKTPEQGSFQEQMTKSFENGNEQ